jgi:hypothetical protein
MVISVQLVENIINETFFGSPELLRMFKDLTYIFW